MLRRFAQAVWESTFVDSVATAFASSIAVFLRGVAAGPAYSAADKAVLQMANLIGRAMAGAPSALATTVVYDTGRHDRIALAPGKVGVL